MVGYEYYTHYLPMPRTIDYAASHLSVDFNALVDFHSGKIDELPVDVVKPTRGLTAHWIKPKPMLERYFRTRELPHGAFNREYAETARYYAEHYPID